MQRSHRARGGCRRDGCACTDRSGSSTADGQHNGYGANEFSKLSPLRCRRRRTFGIHRRSSQRMSSVSMTSTLGRSRGTPLVAGASGAASRSLGASTSSRCAGAGRAAEPHATVDATSAAMTSRSTACRTRLRCIEVFLGLGTLNRGLNLVGYFRKADGTLRGVRMRVRPGPRRSPMSHWVLLSSVAGRAEDASASGRVAPPASRRARPTEQ